MAVNSPTRATEAKALANAARAVIAGASGTKPQIKTVPQLIAEIQKLNGLALVGKNVEAWSDFSARLAVKISGLITTRTTVDDCVDMLTEIAVPLERVAQK